MKPLRISHLTLKNWRNFKLVDVDVQDRLVVVGPNSSGKSNLLDAVRFLRDIAKRGGGFQEAVAARGGLQRVRCLAARNFNHGRVQLAVSLGDSDAPDRWRYELDFTAESRGQHRPVLAQERVWRDGNLVLDRPDSDDDADGERLIQTALEQVNANRDFRRIADLMSSVRYLNLVPALVREPGATNGDSHYGADLLVRLAGAPESTRMRRLQKVNEALALVVPQIGDLELVRDHSGRPHLQARYHHWRASGARQDEQDLSDGTLRLIGILWSLLETGKSAGPLLLEEPELSLHDSIVRRLPSLLARVQRSGGPQVIVTTHAAAMLADEGLGLDEALVLFPGAEGTTAKLARDVPDVRELLEAGLTLGAVLEPVTQPPEADKLSRLAL